MLRRTLLAAAAATATTSAFGLSQTGRAPGGPNASGPDTQYIQQTMAIGSLALATSRIAEEKARFPKLKEFAQFEVAEQETVADVLKSLQNSGLTSGTVKPPSEAEVEQHLDQSGREKLQKMKAAQAGGAFDQEYHEAQVEGHEQLLRIQEDHLKSGRNLDSINVAKLARGMIKEHLQLLADIKTEMGGATTGAAPTRR